VWQRDLVSDYAPGKNFFGLGSTPLFLEGRLVLNVGGAGDVCAVALDPATGREVWRARQLTVRMTYSYFSQKRGRELEEFKELTQLVPMGYGDDMLRFNGIGERITFGMYNNERPTEADKEQLYQAARWAAGRGMTLTQHWHGDASVHHLLEVFERVNREIPIGKLRWSIAHLRRGFEVLTVSDGETLPHIASAREALGR
jgi:hypothetical protein